MPYSTIQSDSVISTIDRLARRIEERFPNRGLTGVAQEVAAVARRNEASLAALRRPFWAVKGAVVFLLGAGALALLGVTQEVKLPSLMAMMDAASDQSLVFDLFSGVEAAVNILVLFGAGIFFLLRHEERAKRARALRDLYALRSLAHVIDMHQLTKDPTVILSPERRTASSPREVMTPFELTRYLDYCAELLSLVAKCAALYAQDSRDPLVIESVNDLENMTANLARKIWQKITLVRDLPGADPALA